MAGTRLGIFAALQTGVSAAGPLLSGSRAAEPGGIPARLGELVTDAETNDLLVPQPVKSDCPADCPLAG